MTSEKKQSTASQASLFNKEKAQKTSGPINLDKPYKTIRVAVSGDVILTKLEVSIIDAVSFQRLRKYRQLGTSYLVYPSAHHTRFEHSLGVLEVADRMITLIESNEHSEDVEKDITDKQKRITRLAALLHDIANIPFGHTLEDETNVVRTYQEDKKRLLFWLDEDTEIGKILIDSLGQEEYKLLINVLTSKNDPESENNRSNDVVYISDLKENAFIVDLIKNTVCADLLDYLARDTYFCGLPLILPDRFMRYLYLNIDSKGIRRVAIRLWKQKKDNRPRAALISELIQLLEIRYFLAERVYFHHAKVISSAMIAAAVWYAQHQETKALSTKKLNELGDDELLKELRNKNKYPIACQLAERLDRRNLYKRFYSISRARIDAVRLHDHLDLLKQKYHKDAENRAKHEQLLSDYAGLEKGDVIIYCPDPNMNLKIAKMLVTSRKGGIDEFCNTDDRLVKQKMGSIIESHRNLWELQVFVNPILLQSEHKKQILYHWCQVFFEPPQSNYQTQSNEKIALSSVIEDLWRNSDLKKDQIVKDKIVVEALSQMRDGSMDKKTLVSIMERHINESQIKK